MAHLISRKRKIYGYQVFRMINFFKTSMKYQVPQWKTFGDLKFEKYCLFVRFQRRLLILTTPTKKSGPEAINLGFFIKINNFMKKIDDLSHKTIMITKEIPPKIVKIDLHSNQSKKVIEQPSIWDFSSKSLTL